MIYKNHFFSKVFQNIRNLYLNSNIYDKKISKIIPKDLIYKPSPNLLSSIIKYQKKKFKVEDFSSEGFWLENVKKKESKKINNFFWFFSLDLKSSKKTTQSIISNWIKLNSQYNSQSWDFNITAKRIIAWLSCYNLSFEESQADYKNIFNTQIQKQTNHLINEINQSNALDNKLVGCAAIILVGLCYGIEKKYLNYGFDLLKKISKIYLDNSGFPKSRNIKQLVTYLKYFILIREWCKESQTNIPEHIDETIYYLGQGYAFIWQNISADLLFNGNFKSKNHEFDNYLKRFGYKFKNDVKELGGYVVLKDKRTCLAMDVGSSPNQKFTRDYQSGALSFEIVRNGQKLISNCGYYKKKDNLNLNKISKSTATQNTLIIDDKSSCEFDNSHSLKKGLKILKKNFIHEKNYWKINASHDGYLKKYDSIHEREIEYYPEQKVFVGIDKIIKKKTSRNHKFDIRFHIEPKIKLMKTQDNKSIFIELENEGWKFTCDNYHISIDNGLYFGNKNSYNNNQNIFITGITRNEIEKIIWKIKKI